MNRVKILIDKIIRKGDQDTSIGRLIKLLFKLIEKIISKLPFYDFIKPILVYMWNDHRKIFLVTTTVFIIVFAGFFAYLVAEFNFMFYDSDDSRGALALQNSTYDGDYTNPLYLEQNWTARDSLYFYNTSIGSNLIPYDFFLVLEQADSSELFRANSYLDRFRFLSQKPTISNPKGFPVGVTKDTFEGMDYIGLTCAACHTAQINYKGSAIRIDGGPALVNIRGFVASLVGALNQTLEEPDKFDRFAKAVLNCKNDFETKEQVRLSLQNIVQQMNLWQFFQGSHIDYGYGRLDFLGQGLNIITMNTLPVSVLKSKLQAASSFDGHHLLTTVQVEQVTEGFNDKHIVSPRELAIVLNRLESYPALKYRDKLRLRNEIIWEPDAPVRYPEIWNASRDSYMYWSGAISNSLVDQNTHKVLSFLNAFGSVKFEIKEKGLSLASLVSGQSKKQITISMESSIDKINVDRLGLLLQSLKPPQWPDAFGRIDPEKAERGQSLYAEHCQSCHELNDGSPDDLVNSYFIDTDSIGTDPVSAFNTAVRPSPSGNFEDTYQSTEVGDILIGEKIQSVILAKAILPTLWASPDPDKNMIDRQIDKAKTLMNYYFAPNYSSVHVIRNGKYFASDAANPLRSLFSYRAKPLAGVWATAPYLHNGSVPDLWSLLLPFLERPVEFCMGSREFDPVKVGFKSSGCDLSDPKDRQRFLAIQNGNSNTGHEYGVKLSESERYDLIEYLKTL